MSAKILDARTPAQKIKNELRRAVSGMNVQPSLAIIHSGGDPAGDVYVRGKVKDAAEIGIRCDVISPLDSGGIVQAVINATVGYHGVIIQQPAPYRERWERLLAPSQDVDGLTPYNMGFLAKGDVPVHMPCTPAGIMELLKYYNIEVEGKHVCIVGRSQIVGRPLASLMLNANATVSLCHSKTKNLSELTKISDIVVVAVGKAKFLTADMIKPGAILIDVGINRDEKGKLCGDVDFEGCKEKAAAISPVPNGVGLMTRAMLMRNVVNAARY